MSQSSKVIIIVAGSYDLHGKGATSTCAVGDVWEANTAMVASLIQNGDMRFATGQEITDAMTAGKAF